jgi:DNA-binding NarL/FixJ family response regulator
MLMIDILVVDDHALVRRTLRAVLETEASLKVVGEAQDGLEAIRVAEEVRPHVVLMDVYMPRMDGIESTRHIRARVPESCIIGMSSDSRPWVEDAFRSAGARAFLAKELIPAHLVEVIQKECSL